MTTTDDLLRTAQRDRPAAPLARGVPRLESLRAGTATGIGSLPHRSAGDAARFALAEYDIPAIPSLPAKNPAEGMIAQAVVGINGVTSGQYGSLAVDASAVERPRTGHHRPDAAALPEPAAVPSPRRHVRLLRPAEVAVRRTGHARRCADPRRSRRRHRVPGRGARRALARRGDLGGDHHGDAELATADLHRRAVVRRTAEPGLPDRPRHGDRPAVGRDGGGLRRRDRRRALLRARPTSRRCSQPGPTSCRSRSRRGSPGSPATSATSSTPAGGSPGASFPPTGRCSRRPIATGGSCSSCGDALSDRGVDFDLLRSRSLVTPHCGLGTHTPVVADRVCRAVREVGRRIADLSPRNVLA